MSDDVLEQLRRENPVPEQMPALPIEPLLARLDADPPSRAIGGRGTRRLRQALPVALSVVVVLAVAGGALLLAGRDHRRGSSADAGAALARRGRQKQAPNPPKRQPKQVAPAHFNPFRIARENAHDTPLSYFAHLRCEAWDPEPPPAPERQSSHTPNCDPVNGSQARQRLARRSRHRAVLDR